MIPGDDLVRTTPKQGIPDAVESIFVRHISGMISVCTLKSYDQGRKAFQGTAQDVIWLDEESDEMIRGECVMRLMTTQGLLIETFTPLEGITPIVKMYLPGGEMKASVSGAILSSQKALVMAGWDDVPHLSEEDKARMAAETLPYQLEARRTGTPSLGSGAIYPVPEAQITVDDFAIPDHWLRAYGMDVGWDFTAALWGALDRESDILYLYSVYKGGKSEPPIHATAIKARGEWIPGKADSAATNQDDGEKMLTLYQNEGLLITLPDKSVEVGLYDVWTRLSTGRLKVFKSLAPFFEEYRVYRRDERGRIVKENDHIMDCARYLVRSGLSVAIAKPCIIYDPNAIIRNPRQSTSAMTA
jgi:phage terminase large subunit-like protein